MKRQYLRSEDANKPREDNIVKFHYLSNNITFEGKPLNVFVSIAEDDEGNFFYNINKDKNQPSQDNAVQMRSGEGRKVDNSTVNLNISPSEANVNKSFRQSENNPLGSYMPASRVIHLFKKANCSTLIHEFGHHFTMMYVKALEQNGRTDKLEGFYKWLGITDISQATDETWEQMARGFETYVMEGVAPNIDTENIFHKFRRYLIDIYNGMKPEQINDDVRDFFDKMLAGEEEMPDVRGLEGKLGIILLKNKKASELNRRLKVNL